MKMQTKMLLFGLFTTCCVPSYAVVYDLDVAINNVRDNCVGISSKLNHLKTMAGISTGVGAVGTVAGAGALAAGVVKANKDKEIEDLKKQFEKILTVDKQTTKEEAEETLAKVEKAWAQYVKDAENDSSKKKNVDAISKLEEESKTLGNVRTGLLAGNTATSVVGAVVSSKSKVKGSLKDQVNACLVATEDLRESMMQARMEGQDTTKAKRIVDACGGYKSSDIAKINKFATGSTVTSSIGAVAGGVGMITSIAANTDATRNDNTKEGIEKEKGLNTASNVLSGITTATSATSTVLSGVQIATIKKVVSIADNCEKELR